MDSLPPYVRRKPPKTKEISNVSCFTALFDTEEFCLSSSGNALDPKYNRPPQAHHEAGYPKCVGQSVSTSCLLRYPAKTGQKKKKAVPTTGLYELIRAKRN